MDDYRAEFLVEPFTEGSPGPAAVAGIEAVREAGLTPDVGAFGTSVEGDGDAIAGAVGSALRAAIDAGATRVSVVISRVGES